METQERRLRPDSGLCFGSRFLGEDVIRPLEVLPGTSLNRIRNREDFWLAWLIDICACHVDNCQAFFLKDGACWLNAFFVDHGHLFGGPNGQLRRHFIASRYLDPRIYQGVSLQKFVNFWKIILGLDVEQLLQDIQMLPDDWKTPSALGGFVLCLDRLSTSNLLQDILDSMIDAVQKADKREYGNQQCKRAPSVSGLCPGVQASRVEYGVVEKSCNRAACA